MARPSKNNLEFIPLAVGFFSDPRVAACSGEFGAKGEAILLRLLCAVYRQDGYFALWSSELRSEIASQIKGCTENLVEQVVRRLVHSGMFDSALFSRSQVLTSAEIQLRYLAAKRKQRFAAGQPHILVSAPPPRPDPPPPKAPDPPAQRTMPSDYWQSVQAQQPQIIPVEQEVAALATDRAWQESIRKATGSTADEISDALSWFADFCIAGGKNGHYSIDDCKAHFRDLLIKRKNLKIAANATNHTRTNNPSATVTSARASYGLEE